VAEHITVRRVAPGVWVHITEGRVGTGWYPANGLLVETTEGGLLVDTGWDAEQGEALLRWAESIGHPVRTAIVTHAHDDRTGGIAAMSRAGVRVIGLPRTAALATAEGRSGVEGLPRLETGPVEADGVEVYYPGPGHAPDNVVVFVPSQRVLFGGCLIKADTATTVGNVADADVPGWPAAVARVRTRYPRAAIVVPGHGAIGGPAALTHTEGLITAKGPAALEAYRRSRAD
jgi:metallo-beta-lactamase class B